MLTRDFLDALTPSWPSGEVILIVGAILAYWIGSIGLMAWAVRSERHAEATLAMRYRGGAEDRR